MSRTATRGRIFRKYAAVLILLVGGVLLLSSLVSLAFSYRETRTALVRLERRPRAEVVERQRLPACGHDGPQWDCKALREPLRERDGLGRRC